MNLRSLIFFTSIAILVLNSCNKSPVSEPINTSYLDGLVGDYLIECQVNYLDSNGFHQYIDTAFVGALTSSIEDQMFLEFIDSSTIELVFTYDHRLGPGCTTSGFVNNYGNWTVENGVPSFQFGQNYFECIVGFSGSSLDIDLSARKI